MMRQVSNQLPLLLLLLLPLELLSTLVTVGSAHVSEPMLFLACSLWLVPFAVDFAFPSAFMMACMVFLQSRLLVIISATNVRLLSFDLVVRPVC
jgi:hypothetical protein